MKYGIKHDNGAIECVTRFANDVVTAGFVEITKAKYDEFVTAIEANPFATYDDTKNEIGGGAAELAEAQDTIEAKAYRLRLRQLSIELDLMTRLGETTTALQTEFDTLKATYLALDGYTAP